MDDPVHRHLAARIRELARRKRLSVNKLADFSGLGRGFLSDVLAQKKSPTVRTLSKLADALDVEVRDLFSDEVRAIEKPGSRSRSRKS